MHHVLHSQANWTNPANRKQGWNHTYKNWSAPTRASHQSFFQRHCEKFSWGKWTSCSSLWRGSRRLDPSRGWWCKKSALQDPCFAFRPPQRDDDIPQSAQWLREYGYFLIHGWKTFLRNFVCVEHNQKVLPWIDLNLSQRHESFQRHDWCSVWCARCTCCKNWGHLFSWRGGKKNWLLVFKSQRVARTQGRWYQIWCTPTRVWRWWWLRRW